MKDPKKELNQHGNPEYERLERVADAARMATACDERFVESLKPFVNKHPESLLGGDIIPLIASDTPDFASELSGDIRPS